MLMRTRDETLNQYCDYDSIFEPVVYSSDWERIINTAYEYEDACRQARTQAQTVQK